MRRESCVALITALLCGMGGCASKPLTPAPQPLQAAQQQTVAAAGSTSAALGLKAAAKTAPASANSGNGGTGSAAASVATVKVPLDAGATSQTPPVVAIASAGTGVARRASGGGYLGGNGSTAHEVGDGSDDDIIARRLRKAVENETDPDLKVRLWKEYVDYRNGTQK